STHAASAAGAGVSYTIDPPAGGTVDTGTPLGSAKVNNLAFGPTTAAASAVQFGGGSPIALVFTNSYNGTFSLYVTLSLGNAQFVGQPTVKYLVRKTGVTYSASTVATTATSGKLITSTAPGINPLQTGLIIQNLALTNGASIGGASG